MHCEYCKKKLSKRKTHVKFQTFTNTIKVCSVNCMKLYCGKNTELYITNPFSLVYNGYPFGCKPIILNHPLNHLLNNNIE